MPSHQGRKPQGQDDGQPLERLTGADKAVLGVADVQGDIGHKGHAQKSQEAQQDADGQVALADAPLIEGIPVPEGLVQFLGTV